MDLKTAKVLVTGGSSGIGLATARLLKASGAKIAICGRNQERLNKVAQELDVLAVPADVSNENSVISMIKTVIDKLSGYNVLINNAAYGYFAPLVEIDVEEFQRMMATNLTGAMLVGRESAKHFISQNTGNIVNIGSTASHKGFVGGTAYAASKFALTAMTESWRSELRKNNIRVMQVNPSEVVTAFRKVAGFGPNTGQRKLQPEDIAHAIKSVLELEDRGFVTELTVWATNPEE